MADTPVSPEEQALRRRARRRLVGAVALALVAVVVLPMVFDPEPKPLGSDVEIVIPEQTTPFQDAPPGDVPNPAQVPAETVSPAPLPVPEAPAPQSSPGPEVKPAPPAAKPELKPVAKSEPKPVAKKPEPPAPTPASGYFLQLGAFSQEDNARQQADKAKAAGFKAGVVSSAGQSKVRVGPYGSRELALAAQTKLKAKGLDSVLIGP